MHTQQDLESSRVETVGSSKRELAVDSLRWLCGGLLCSLLAVSLLTIGVFSVYQGAQILGHLLDADDNLMEMIYVLYFLFAFFGTGFGLMLCVYNIDKTSAMLKRASDLVSALVLLCVAAGINVTMALSIVVMSWVWHGLRWIVDLL